MTASDRPSAQHPRCRACQHPDVAEIDGALVSGTAAAVVARTHGLPARALRRHADRHLPEALVRAQDAADVFQADRLLAELGHLHARTLAILDKAEADGEPQVALRAIDAARRNLELLAKLADAAVKPSADGSGLSIVVYGDTTSTSGRPIIPTEIRPARPGELDGDEW